MSTRSTPARRATPPVASPSAGVPATAPCRSIGTTRCSAWRASSRRSSATSPRSRRTGSRAPSSTGSSPTPCARQRLKDPATAHAAVRELAAADPGAAARDRAPARSHLLVDDRAGRRGGGERHPVTGGGHRRLPPAARTDRGGRPPGDRPRPGRHRGPVGDGDPQLHVGQRVAARHPLPRCDRGDDEGARPRRRSPGRALQRLHRLGAPAGRVPRLLSPTASAPSSSRTRPRSGDASTAWTSGSPSRTSSCRRGSASGWRPDCSGDASERPRRSAAGPEVRGAQAQLLLDFAPVGGDRAPGDGSRGSSKTRSSTTATAWTSRAAPARNASVARERVLGAARALGDRQMPHDDAARDGVQDAVAERRRARGRPAG